MHMGDKSVHCVYPFHSIHTIGNSILIWEGGSISNYPWFESAARYSGIANR